MDYIVNCLVLIFFLIKCIMANGNESQNIFCEAAGRKEGRLTEFWLLPLLLEQTTQTNYFSLLHQIPLVT